jgi:hypothetical protein
MASHPILGTMALTGAAATSPKLLGKGINALDTATKLYQISKKMGIPQTFLRNSYINLIEKAEPEVQEKLREVIGNNLKNDGMSDEDINNFLTKE